MVIFPSFFFPPLIVYLPIWVVKANLVVLLFHLSVFLVMRFLFSCDVFCFFPGLLVLVVAVYFLFLVPAVSFLVFSFLFWMCVFFRLLFFYP